MPDLTKRLRQLEVTVCHEAADEIERLVGLLTHAWNGGEVQTCEACRQWFRLEETLSMDESGWICKSCAGSPGSPKDANQENQDDI